MTTLLGRDCRVAVLGGLAALLAACGSSSASGSSHDPVQALRDSVPTADAGAGGAPAPAAASNGGGAGPVAANGGGNTSSGVSAATPWATRVPYATPASAGGHATAQTATQGDITQTGSTCSAGGGEAVFLFGTPGSGEEIHVAIHSGYTGPGTYSSPNADAYVSVTHHGHTWYAQFSAAGSGASITVDSGGRSGSFVFADQVDTRERVTGVFVCG